jgi:hypothetical protein
MFSCLQMYTQMFSCLHIYYRIKLLHIYMVPAASVGGALGALEQIVPLKHVSLVHCHLDVVRGVLVEGLGFRAYGFGFRAQGSEI